MVERMPGFGYRWRAVPVEGARGRREDGQVTETVWRPAYQEVAADLRRRIALAEFPVGSAIPSTAKLTKSYGVSSTVVRASIAQLRADGLLVGQPGKGVFVRATPRTVAQRAVSIDELARRVEELRTFESARWDEVAAEVAELRQHMRMIQKHLAGLYAQLGRPVPADLAAL
jgi:DNA-binding FadR family transcriptional regulator